ncbi:MAG: hypothetical protein F6K16_31080 [Symploca sp. SIO2B6]|nr:hypothetical protein [Symploca sp. SIO2B6]
MCKKQRAKDNVQKDNMQIHHNSCVVNDYSGQYNAWLIDQTWLLRVGGCTLVGAQRVLVQPTQ